MYVSTVWVQSCSCKSYSTCNIEIMFWHNFLKTQTKLNYRILYHYEQSITNSNWITAPNQRFIHYCTLFTHISYYYCLLVSMKLMSKFSSQQIEVFFLHVPTFWNALKRWCWIMKAMWRRWNTPCSSGLFAISRIFWHLIIAINQLIKSELIFYESNCFNMLIILEIFVISQEEHY